MTKENDNGHKGILDEAEEIRETTAPVITDDDLEGGFRIKQVSDPAQQLMSPDNRQIPNLFMKGTIPSYKCVYALAHGIATDREHNDIGSENFRLMLIAGSCGKNSARAELIADICIGQRRNAHGGPIGSKGSVMDRIKNWMGGD